MHSIAHLLLLGSMVAAAIGALTFCLVLGAFGFTPAEGQPDEVARRERLARIGRLVAGTGFGLAALFGVVGVAASPSGGPALQPQLEALRGRLGEMTTRLGHIADLADHLRVHVGDRLTPAVPGRCEAPAATADDRGERAIRTDRAERSERIDRPEKVDRVDRPERVEKVERVERVERPERIERVERPERIERVERPDRVERVEKVERVERRERIDRPERSGRH